MGKNAENTEGKVPGWHLSKDGVVRRCANTRKCLLPIVPAPAPKPKTANSGWVTVRGYAYELLVAEALVARSREEFGPNHPDTAYLKSTTSPQYISRKEKLDRYSEVCPQETAELIEKAKKVVSQLGVAIGPVDFTSSSINPDEVYDILYTTADGLAKLSCKTGNMEDKAYRFNSTNYQLHAVSSLNEELFGNYHTGNTSYEQALTIQGMSVSDYQEKLTDTLMTIALDNNNADHATLLDLTSKSFVGNGGYAKTTASGDVVNYPQNTDNRAAVIVPGSVRKISGNTFGYTAEIHNSDTVNVYDITMRVKFKDGKNKPVTFNSTGQMSNIASTVTVKCVSSTVK